MAIADLNLSSLLVVFFGGGGIIGAIVAFLKYRREADSVIAEAAEKTATAAGLILENLQKEIVRLNELVGKLTHQLEERDQIIKQLSTDFASTITKAKDEVIAAMPNHHALE